MLKYSLQLLIPLTVILVVGCTGVPTPKIILDDVDEIRPLTEEEIKEYEDLIAEFQEAFMLFDTKGDGMVPVSKVLIKLIS